MINFLRGVPAEEALVPVAEALATQYSNVLRTHGPDVIQYQRPGLADFNGFVPLKETLAKRFGIGPYMIANGLIYAMNDMGVLTLIKATPAGYRQLAQAKVLEGPESWGPMAVVSGRLILRDLKKMICLDITEQ